MAMRTKLFLIAVVLSISTSLISCGGGKDVPLSPEMQGFVGMFKGNDNFDITKAFKKYGANDEVIVSAMKIFPHKNPKVTKVENDCYSVAFESGILALTYDICWSEGKISKVIENGTK